MVDFEQLGQALTIKFTHLESEELTEFEGGGNNVDLHSLQLFYNQEYENLQYYLAVIVVREGVWGL